MKIRLISAQDTYPIRHQVLKPYLKNEAEVFLEGDRIPSSFHVGVFENEEIITIASFFQENHPQFPQSHLGYRLRGMASKKNQSHKGYGKAAIEFAENILMNRNCDLLWCHAREVAYGFYEKLSFQYFGNTFDIPQIGPHKIMWKKISSPSPYRTKTELLLPVGNFDMALAAIHNGADAIYIGTPGFNARGRSYDHDLDELKVIIETCHLYGVKVNLALNIVIFENELVDVIRLIERILPLNPDAFIVQDLGLARIIRMMAPNQALHASTQMTITNFEAMQFIDDLKFKRFVVGRENSIDEMKLIRRQTDQELEVFVHGALCVSYSGQCFTSESIGGRSANRGQCAQSCRFSYDLIIDGEKKNLVDRNYLVSPQDLCGIAEIPQLIDLGINTFKIEGRLKTPEYVASAAQEYRQAIDRHFSKNDLSDKEINHAKKNMATTYSRGFYSGWLHGVQHQKLVEGTFSNHRGYEIGTIHSLSGTCLKVELQPGIELTPGDGLKWAYKKNGETIEGGAQIYGVQKVSSNFYLLELQRDLVITKDMSGARLFINHDHNLKKELTKSFQDKNYFKRVPIQFHITIESGKSLKASIYDGLYFIELQTTSIVEPAAKKGVSDELVREEFSALAATVFKAAVISIDRKQTEAIYIHHKEIKQLRRELCEQLTNIRSRSRMNQMNVTHFNSEKVIESFFSSLASKNNNLNSHNQTLLNIILRDRQQVGDLVSAISNQKIILQKIHAVILDFEFGRDYESSLQLLKSVDCPVGIATTRILKPQEYNNLKVLVRLNPDFILVRNLGAANFLTQNTNYQGKLIGDFSLNITNHVTVDYLLKKNFHSLCLSYDLNINQIELLLEQSVTRKLEITAHQYMPSFHMEHCVFAAFLSNGSSFRDCGKPCEKHRVELKDQFGNHHQIKADQECRNTMFNSVSQSAAQYVQQWQNLGLGFIRYEALFENGNDLIQKIQAYIDLLNGQKTADQLSKELQLSEKYGLGTGAISKEREYVSRKKS